MIPRKKKICKICGNEKEIFSKGRCYNGARATYKPIKKSNPDKTIKRNVTPGKPGRMAKTVRKKTGELQLFQEIWEERKHACQVCGEPLPAFDIWNFAHVLGKKAYQKFRLEKANIILMCRKHHHQYDNQSTADDPLFTWVLELKQKLKEKYYELFYCVTIFIIFVSKLI